ncbi:uncharacterized protein LOC127632407 isoform X2 [Xyrauchen texanus]|uniref:uncharacterized protein LOC127632407 isoform X2 n=1 Tax=Xyrauchen texanus TaxID=154827 RepID=UPI002241F682|nr:uncharacterized protein LOC127632407 isoform X2 [Xyrauchen texanus]
MIHTELMGEDGEEMHLQMESFAGPNISPVEKSTEAKEKRTTSEYTTFVSSTKAKSDLCTEDNSDKEPCQPAESRPEYEKTPIPHVMVEGAPRKIRREKRPQSLNLGRSRDFVYETEAKSSNITQDSVESDEDNNTEDTEETLICPPEEFNSSPDTWSPSMAEKLNQPATNMSVGTPLEKQQRKFDKVLEKDLQIPNQGAVRSDDARKLAEDQEKPGTEVKIMNTEDKQENQDSVNGPGKDELNRVKADVRFEVMNVTMIDNCENKEEPGDVIKQRMEGLGLEKKINNTELDKAEGIQLANEPRKSNQRETGHVRTDITRIVPLKPERVRSQSYKDDLEIRQGSEIMKIHFKRYSINESFESHFDPSKFESRDTSSSYANFTTSPVNAYKGQKESSTMDHLISETAEQQVLRDLEGSPQERAMQDNDTAKHTSRMVHGDLLLPDEGISGVQPHISRTPVHQKNAPPTPPIKTKKARESGLFLRNSRNFNKDPTLEADKKNLLECLSNTTTHEDPQDDVKQRPASTLEDDYNSELAGLKDIHLAIERKCSSMTVSSTSSLEAEVDFSVITDLHCEMDEFSRGMAELGEKDQQVEMGRESCEEPPMSHSTHHLNMRDVSLRRERFIEGHPHQDIEPPPVAKKDPSAVSAAHILRKVEPHSNGSEIPHAVEEHSMQEDKTAVNCKETNISSTDNIQPQKVDTKQEESIAKVVKENGSPLRTNSLASELVVSPLTITTENVTSATTTQVTKTVKGGYAETRIEKRIIITGDDDVDQHQALAMAIQEAKQQHPDMLVTKAVVVRETDSSYAEKHRTSES